MNKQQQKQLAHCIEQLPINQGVELIVALDSWQEYLQNALNQSEQAHNEAEQQHYRTSLLHLSQLRKNLEA